MVSLHTHGQLLILPYNFQRFTYPEDFKDLDNVAHRIANAIYNAGETEYKVGTASDMFGPATGGAIDWIKMNTFIKYVYVIELPPPLTSEFCRFNLFYCFNMSWLLLLFSFLCLPNETTLADSYSKRDICRHGDLVSSSYPRI
jgi:hypothetical protein